MTAIVLAIGFSAFTKPAPKAKTTDTFYLFSFKSTVNPAIQANVQSTSSYTFVRALGSEDAICDQGTIKPCEIAVNQLDTKVVNGATVIDPAKVSIAAALGTSSFYVVTSLTATNTLPATPVFNKSTN